MPKRRRRRQKRILESVIAGTGGGGGGGGGGGHHGGHHSPPPPPHHPPPEGTGGFNDSNGHGGSDVGSNAGQNPSYQHGHGAVAGGPGAGHATPSGQHVSAGPPAWVVSRQRLLRAAGYPVRVDGVWGARSQHYWNVYLGLTGQSSSAATASASLDARRLNEARARAEQARQRIAAAQARLREQQARRLAEARARAQSQILSESRNLPEDTRGLDAQAKLEHFRVRRGREQMQDYFRNVEEAQVLRDSMERGRTAMRGWGMLQRHPEEARYLDVNRFASIILDPAVEGQFDPLNKKHVTAAQEFLRAHGHKDLAVDGVWGRATNEAFLSSMRRAAEQQRREENRALSNALYRTGVIKEGDDFPFWWRPESMSGDNTVPSPGELLRILNRGGHDAQILFAKLVNLWQSPSAQFAQRRRQEINSLYRGLFGYDPFGAFADKHLPRSFRDKMADIVLFPGAPAVSTDGMPPAQRALTEWNNNGMLRYLQALRDSQTAGQLRRRLDGFSQKEDALFTRYNLERNAEGHGFFGPIMGFLGWVADTAEDFQNNIIAFRNRREREEAALQAYVARHDRPLSDVFRDDPYTRGELARAREDIQNFGLAHRVAFEIIVDPVNLFPFGKAWSLSARAFRRGTWAAGHGLGELGLRISRADGIAGDFGLAVARVGKAVEKAPEFRGYLTSYASRVGHTLATVTPDSGIGREMVASTINSLRLVTRLKTEALIQAQRSVEYAARHNFRSTKSLGIAGMKDQHTSSQTRKLLDASIEDVKNMLPTVFPRLVRDLVASNGSLFVDQGRRYLSNVGAALRARAFEEFRVQEIQRIALKYARMVEDAAYHGLPEDAITDDFRSLVFEQKFEEYKRVRNAFGTHARGSGDPELLRELNARLAVLTERWESSILPALQDLLEEAAEQAGLKLWDESKLWAFRAAEMSEGLRAVAREAFEELEEVANPMFQVPVPYHVADDLMQSEIRRRQAQVLDFVGRETAGGKTFTEDWIQKRLGEEAQAVRDAWTPLQRGMWEDTRETLHVSKLYARHLSLGDDKLRGELADLSRATTPTGRAGIDTEIQASSWWLRGGTFVGDDEAVLDPALRAFRATKAGEDAVLGFSRAVKTHEAALARATDEALPLALARQLSLMQALSAVQYKPVRMLYKGIQASLAGWIFLTLPLRPGWMVRNVVDNVAKAFVAGHVDPRAYFPNVSAKAGETFISVFDLNLRAVRHAAYFLDRFTGQDVGRWLDGVYETFWEHDVETLRAIFSSHLYEVPDEVLGAAKWVPYRDPAPMSRTKTIARRLTLSEDDDILRALSIEVPDWEALHDFAVEFDREAIDAVRREWKLPADRVQIRYVDEKVDDLWLLGEYDPDVGLLVVNVPLRSLRAVTAARAKEMRAELLNTLLHELRHARQAEFLGNGFLGNRLWRLDAKLPYRWQPGEIDARRFAKRGVERGAFDDLAKLEATDIGVGRILAKTDPGLIERFKDGVWELMATRPENFSKKAIFRDTMKKAVDAGDSEIVAFRKAWAEVDRVLFDYSKKTVAESDFRVFFPFIDFWRKNTTFWMKTAIKEPRLPYNVYNAEELRDEVNADLPEWMRRYVQVELPIGDILSHVPGLGWLADFVGNPDVATDPMNFLSFAPLYRAFKEDNPLLPADKAGWRFIAPFVDAINQWGLSFNPFFRKPLEDLGVFNYRAWQQVFPETTLMIGLSRPFLGKYADELADIDAWFGDPLFKSIGLAPDASQRLAASFNVYVQMEMANQAARGEPVSRARAQRKLEAFFLVQTTLAFFGGVYARRMTPEDVYLYQLIQREYEGKLDFNSLGPDTRDALRLWGMRKANRVEFDRYLEIAPLIRAYYTQPSFEAAEQFKQDHPEIVSYVDPAWRRKPYNDESVRDLGLVLDTRSAFQMWDLVDKTDLPDSVSQLAERALVTPTLRAFWDRNDTPADLREKMIRGEYYRYLNKLQETYFAIPESDFEARSGYLAENPALQRWWQENNTDYDDYRAIVNSVNADMREVYFDLLGDGPDPDWDSANAFLHAHPFIFEFTSAANKVDPETGEWVSAAGSSSGSGRTRSQHARDYLAAKPYLDYYFSLAESERSAWLNGGSEGARIVRGYFAKYASGYRSGGYGGSQGGMTAHARDYLAVKRYLDHYFSLPKSERSAWLHSDAPGAKIVLDYFKKYGKTHQLQRAIENLPTLGIRSAELARRIAFWRKYFSLTPDKRPAFVLRHAADYGIFVFGMIGEQERNARRQEWMRRAIAAGATSRAAAYLWVKPLLDLYFRLKKSDRPLFVKANPELSWYFDNYARSKSVTGDPKLDKLVEKYFDLPEDSPARTDFLRKHPEVQDYFDSKATPAERALHNILEVYFQLPVGPARRDFLISHPEIQEYFDRRARERDNETEQLLPFEQADPRLTDFFSGARYLELAAERERQKLAISKIRSLSPDTLDVRRDRSPA